MDITGILMYITLITPKDLPSDWKAIAMCESSMNPKAISKTGKFMGLFQFSQASWEFVGGKGKPHKAHWRVQFAMAKKLKDKQGWNAWPQCSRKTGLL
jgi:resuscitation-promoting factor RpfB